MANNTSTIRWQDADWSFAWDPETGYYTSYWLDLSADFIDIHGLIHSLLLPLTQVMGAYTYLIFWCTFITGLYLYTQETTMPFVAGVLTGALLAAAFVDNPEIVMIMTITMAFAGGGILAKALLGRT